MESDNSVMECIPDSSKLDNVIGDDSLLFLAMKNDAGERFSEATKTWKSIVTCIFGTDDESSQHVNWGQMTISPKITPLCSYNKMMKLLKKIPNK